MATIVDSSRTTSPSMYNGCGTTTVDQHSPPPPLPARLHHHVREPPRPATALGHPRDHQDDGGGYLAPVASRRPRGGFVGGPPLPPRQPLRRSLSLTHHRAPPEPRRDGTASGLTHHHTTAEDTSARRPDTGHEPTLDEVLASLRRSGVDSLRPAPLLPARSAPLLGQVCDSCYIGDRHQTFQQGV